MKAEPASPPRPCERGDPRNGIGRGFGVDNGQFAVDGDAQAEVMKVGSAGACAGSKRHVFYLDVRDASVEIPQAIIARERFDVDGASVPKRAGNG